LLTFGRLARLQRGTAWQKNQFAVEAIDLKVRQGEFIAIVGPSGCGKSTFMKLTTGLEDAVDGQDPDRRQPVTGPLKISGMAFQAPSLLPWRSTVDNVLLPLEIVEPYRSNFKPSARSTKSVPASCCRRLGWGATKTSSPGSCRAACSSAPAFAAR
jgi:NitT/TauT family transport system ATP-binding protein